MTIFLLVFFEIIIATITNIIIAAIPAIAKNNVNRIALFLVTSVSASSLSPMLITLSSAGVHLLSISFVAAVIFPAFISFIIEYPIVPQSFKAFEY